MKIFFSVPAVILLMILTTGFATAQPEQWQIDKAHSSIYFDVRHTYATVRGQFEDYSGTLKFDANRMELGSVEFEVKTKSINTGIPNRDNHLRAEEFFDVRQHPVMTFKSIAVKQKEGSQFTVEGHLTVKGRTRKVMVPFTYFGARDNPLKKGQRVAGFEARFVINRLDYQVGPGKYAEMGTIANEVNILVTLEVVK